MFQCITGSTHQLCHTLDLVLYMGIPVLDHYFSDHNPIVFNITLLRSPPKNNLLLIMLVQLQLQVSDFSSVFYAYSLSDTIVSPSILMGPEELVNLFNNACSDILNDVAPYKLRKHNTKTQPWLNENTCLLSVGKWNGNGRRIGTVILRCPKTVSM